MGFIKTTEETLCKCDTCMAKCVFPYEDESGENSLMGISSNTLSTILNCTHVPKDNVVIFVGGFLDILLCNMLLVANEYYKQNPQQEIWYATHDSKKNLRRVIESYNAAGKKIILVGHSWGGDACAHMMAQNPDIKVDLLITLDPVSKKGPPQKTPNMGKWINVYVDYKISGVSTSNVVAFIGGRWKSVPTADINITQQEWGLVPEKLGSKKLEDLHHADVYWMFFCDELSSYWHEILPDAKFELLEKPAQ